MGVQTLAVSITTAGDSFTGSANGQLGTQEISGKVDGDTLTWSTNITNPMPTQLDFQAKVEGDSMSGNVKLGMFGNAPLSGERA